MDNFKEINRQYVKQVNRRAVLTMLAVYFVSTMLAISGRVLMDHVLKNYAIERLERWTESIINEAPILEAVTIREEATPGSLENIAYKLYVSEDGRLEEIYTAQIDEDIYSMTKLQELYSKHVVKEGSMAFEYSKLNTRPVSIIGIYMTKMVNDKQYVLCGYVPDNVFYHNTNTKNILIVYSIVSILMVIVALSSAGILVRHVRVTKEGRLLLEQYQEAERAEKAQAEFIAKMSHEFRTPLNAILGMNEIIKREHSDAKTAEYTTNIEESAKTLLMMVNEILDYSRIENGNAELNEADYDINRLMENIRHIFNNAAIKKNLLFEVKISDNCPDVLIGDAKKIERVIINIVNNAIKYTKKGGITVTAEYAGSILSIKVQDTGIGIKQEEIPHLFESFSRANMEHNSTIEGTGLGLSIVKELVDLMKGEINVVSCYGEGTTFTILIPQKRGTEEKILLTENETFEAPELKLLIVDDTAINLDVMTKILEPTKMQVDTALSGKEALKMVNENTYDIIFLDARMPVLSGLETYEMMKNENLLGDTKIVMLTADTTAQNKKKAAEAGISTYLEKPVTAQILLNKIAELGGSEKIHVMTKKSKNDTLPDWLMQNEEYDTDAGIRNCGDESAYMEALVRFAKYAPSKIVEIRGYLQGDDIENFTVRIHSVKSVTKMLGIESLSNMARELEEAGEYGDAGYIHQHIGQFLSLYSALACEIEARTENEVEIAANKPTIDDEAVNGILTHMKGYVDDFNDQAVESMINALKGYKFPAQYGDSFEELVTAADNIDWIKMNEILDKMLDVAERES